MLKTDFYHDVGREAAAYQLDHWQERGYASLIDAMNDLASEVRARLAENEGETSDFARAYREYLEGMLSRCD